MFTTDDLEEAGRRAANHPVEAIPDVDQMQREVLRRRQSRRLMVGASAMTAVLFAVGGGILITSRNDDVQVITASPVTEAGSDADIDQPESGAVAGSQASTDGDQGVDGAATGVVEVDESTDGDRDLERSDSDGVDGADGSSSSSADADGETGRMVDGYAVPDLDDLLDEGADDGDWNEDATPFDEYFDLDDESLGLPDDVEEWLTWLQDHGRLADGESLGTGRWFFADDQVFGLDDMDIQVAVGDRALRLAGRAAADADEAVAIDGQTIWIDRQNKAGRDRRVVTVSRLIDGDWFVAAKAPSALEQRLVEMVSGYDGTLDRGLSPDELKRLRDRDWLVWPPGITEWDDFDFDFDDFDWNDPDDREDLEDEFEDYKKDWRKRQEERLEEFRDRFNDRRGSDDRDSDDRDDDDRDDDDDD